MKRNIVSLGLLFILNFSCFAQKIVSAIFADTNNDEIGNGCSIDINTFMHFISRLKDDLGYSLEQPLRYDFDSFTYKNFDDLEKHISSNPEDIIIVYISSHGGRDQLSTNQFPYILFDKLENKRSTFDKFKSLQKLPHKSLLMVIDACNKYLDTSKISETEIKTFGKNYTPFIPKEIKAHEKEVAHSIFLSNCFDVIVTASNPPLISQTTYRGSLFTNSFISSFYEHYGNAIEFANINSVLNDASVETLHESERLYFNDSRDKLKFSDYSAPYQPVWYVEPCIKELKNININTMIDIDTTSFKLIDSISKPSLLRAWSGVEKTVDIKIEVANKDLFNKIKEVKYYLPGFKEQNIKATDILNNFHYRLFLFTNYYLRCKVILNDNRVIDLSKNIIINSSNIWSNKADAKSITQR